MSEENVEVVRRMWEAATRRDLEAMDELIAEDAEFHSVLAASEGGIFRGHQGSRKYFAAIDAAFDDWHPEIEEIIDLDEDRVVVLSHVTARGKASGVPLDQRIGQIITVTDDKVTFIDSYFDQAEALEAAGPSE